MDTVEGINDECVGVDECQAKLIVYGACCVWWDARDKAATLDGEPGGLPCCPNCPGVLFQVEEREWWACADRKEATEPGYRELIEWLRGRCFAEFAEARAAYAASRLTLEF